MAVHRSGRYLFVSDNSAHSAYVFGINPVTGALTGVIFRKLDLTLSRGVVAHPNGRHVIFAGFDGIRVLAFDEAAGTLAPIAGSPFASSFLPQALALDHTGQYLYGVNGDQTSGANDFSHISIHVVNPATGHVTRTGAIDGAAVLMGLAFAASTAPGPTVTALEHHSRGRHDRDDGPRDHRTFTAAAAYSDGRHGPLLGGAWSTGDPGIATIDAATGVATLHGYGTTTISVARSGLVATTNQHGAGLAPGQRARDTEAAARRCSASRARCTATALYADQLSADVTASATWTSSSPSIATVAAGVVFGAGSGTATIAADRTPECRPRRP